MRLSFYHKLAQLSCLSYLIGNIVYDNLDTPDSPANPNWYFMPLMVMISALLLLCLQSSKEKTAVQSFFTQRVWIFFFVLSLSQIVKNFLYNPLITTVNDYGFLVVALIFSFAHFLKHRHRN